MAKGSGGTRNARRNSLSLSLVSGEYDDLLQDAKKIFEKEASDNLGDYKSRKPKKVSDEEYDRLLKSGDYIEVYHGGRPQDVEQLINGKYYVNNELHVSGFGYYFGREKKTAERYSKGAVLTALVKKSDIMPRDGLSTERITNSERYIPKGSKFKNGSAVTDSDRKDLFNTSTLAAHKRYKSAEASYSAVVVVDRSAIIIKKK